MTRTEELIIRSQAGDEQAKQSLVDENNGLIWSVARRFIGRGAETDDLYQLGCLGFLKAVDGFDMRFGTQFSTYAVPKISGEIRRFLRDDGAIKVSRGLKERAAAVNSARASLLQETGREPTLQELAIRTGFSPEEIAEADIATSATESIQQESGEDGFSLEKILCDTQTEDKLLEHISLRQAISKLPEKEALVIHLRYFHGLTQSRVSAVLQVSQVQISRIEKKALVHLKQYLE